ncbi:HigA family addiction module antitoxin [Dyella sp. C11]|uniref:HigA family addiction module antitoxin n=1 Tax=Dyella sp. C11 TaxID=2126991 RepID=UPI000D65E3C1|nr:HigA family addiction module antitoxin [Dyella sp. C11]
MSTSIPLVPNMTPDDAIPLRSPGQVLVQDFVEPLGLPMAFVARTTGISTRRLRDMVKGQHVVTALEAKRLAVAFNTTAFYWMVLQARWSLEGRDRFGGAH